MVVRSAGLAFLAPALRIAHSLVEAAEESGAGARWPHVEADGTRTHPPHLYAGQAGVALFLANAAALGGDPSLEALAQRALELAWERCLAGSAPLNPAVYLGEGGVLYALLTLGREPGDATTARFAALLARQEVRANELFYGAAGAGVTYLSGFRRLGHPPLLAAAIREAERLEQARMPVDEGCAWAWGGGVEDVYVGFSHGAAGIAYFLVELAETTRDARWLDLARQALAFVRARGESRFGGLVFPVHHPSGGGKPFSYWCHGAPGIALAFLHAFRVTSEERWHETARGCLAATETFLATHEVRLAGQCHGVAGLLEPLIEGGRVLADPALVEAARAHATRLLLPREESGDFASGTPDPACALMLGRTGVGQVLLRLAAPDVISHHGLVLRAPDARA